jgi:hypothetical protein
MLWLWMAEPTNDEPGDRAGIGRYTSARHTVRPGLWARRTLVPVLHMLLSAGD